jgi:hypothetical protein
LLLTIGHGLRIPSRFLRANKLRSRRESPYRTKNLLKILLF